MSVRAIGLAPRVVAVAASLKVTEPLRLPHPMLALLPSARRASRLMQPRLPRLPKTENKDAAAFTQKIPQGTKGP